MKFYSTILAIITTLGLSVQNNDLPSAGNFAILKGHISNNKDTTWNYGAMGYLSGDLHAVAIDKKGNFLEKVTRVFGRLPG